MLTKKQFQIFKTFAKNPFKQFTFNEIKQITKLNSNSLLQTTLSEFSKQEIITTKKLGNISLHSLNFENLSVPPLINLAHLESIPLNVKLSLRWINEELESMFAALVIFGSYAKEEQDNNSDLDIAIFVNSKDHQTYCKRALHECEAKTILDLDYHVILENEMFQMLKDKEENLGKQIAYNHLIVHNAATFYKMIKRGIDEGFKIIYE